MMNRIPRDQRPLLGLGLILVLTILTQMRIATAVAEQRNGMILVSARKVIVGTSDTEQQELARRFDCHPTWLSDDLPRHEATVEDFWMDRFPVTNARYLAFVEATGHVRPSWWKRWGGAFPTEYASHPVVGLSAQDADAYAKWAGKRLPTAEEWEAAIAGTNRAPFAWGDAWPGPWKHDQPVRIWWELPGTHPVGGGGCGRSVAGIEDFAGQVLEWVSNVSSNRGSLFRLLKGASWFHKDPLSFRIASGAYANGIWQSAFSGLRCALDGKAVPPAAPQSQPKQAISVETARRQLKLPDPSEKPSIESRGGTSKSLTLRVPRFGGEPMPLMAPETVLWNRASLLTFRDKPDITWNERTPERATYEMRFPQLRLQAEFLAHDDSIEQRFTATNLGGKAGELTTSSCFRLQELPMFYDCELLRTYALSAGEKFVPVRHLSRGNTRVRWITRLSGEALGVDPRWAVLAVVSRDQQRVIAAGRADPATGFTLANNTLFTCLHADSVVPVAANGIVTTRELFWFVNGTLDDLRKRVQRDLLPGK